MFSYYLKIATRQIAQTPILSSFIVLAIALGIGVSMTMISFYSALAYNPAEDKSEQLFALQLAAYGDDMESWGMDDGLPRQLTHQDSMNLRSNKQGIAQTPIYRVISMLRSRRQDISPTMEYTTLVVDQDFFAMFELEFIYGGPWQASIDTNPAQHVVISEQLNQWIFGGGDNIGKTFVMVNNSEAFSSGEFTVVGVVKNWRPQPNYYDLTGNAFSAMNPAVFIPFSLTAKLEQWPTGSISGWKNAQIESYQNFLQSEYVWQLYWVELPNAATKARFDNYLQGYVDQQRQLGRFQNPNPRAKLRNVDEWLSYNEVINEDNRVMVGLSLLFLLVCLVNTVGLLLAKFLKKMPDAGIRRALGASRRQIFFQYQVEVGLLGLLGGALGLAFCALGLWALRLLYDTQIAQLNPTLTLAALLLALLSSLLTGVLPAYRVCSANPSAFLKAQ